MKTESIDSPCPHLWERVVDAETEQGGKLLMCCKNCSVTKTVPKPTGESSGDGRPILVEG